MSIYQLGLVADEPKAPAVPPRTSNVFGKQIVQARSRIVRSSITALAALLSLVATLSSARPQSIQELPSILTSGRGLVERLVAIHGETSLASHWARTQPFMWRKVPTLCVEVMGSAEESQAEQQLVSQMSKALSSLPGWFGSISVKRNEPCDVLIVAYGLSTEERATLRVQEVIRQESESGKLRVYIPSHEVNYPSTEHFYDARSGDLVRTVIPVLFDPSVPSEGTFVPKGAINILANFAAHIPWLYAREFVSYGVKSWFDVFDRLGLSWIFYGARLFELRDFSERRQSIESYLRSMKQKG